MVDEPVDDAGPDDGMAPVTDTRMRNLQMVERCHSLSPSQIAGSR
jgi:hypothetical protein